MKKKGLQVSLIFVVAVLLSVVTFGALAKDDVSDEVTATESVPFPDQRQAVPAGVAWLVTTHQNEDGGYSDFSSGADQAPSGVGGTVDAVQAIAAAGYNPAANYPGKSKNPVQYLRANAANVAAYAASGGGANGKILMGLTAANQNPRDFMGYNLVVSLTAQLTMTGQYNALTPFDQSLALLGVAAVNQTSPVTATQWLKAQQAANGSWGDGFGTPDNADATAMAIMALVAHGEPVTSSVLVSATNFLTGAQLPTGGWEYGAGFGQNANSTALVVQALQALGEDFATTGSKWAKNGTAPLLVLLTYQNNTGAFQSDFGFGPFDDFFATVQSLPATTGRAYPLPARYEAAQQAVTCLGTLQDVTTGGWEQFAGFGVNAAGTARAIEAIAAAGGTPQSSEWTPGSVNAVAALETLTPGYLANGRGGRVGVVMQGVVAAGAPYTVTSFAEFNLPISVTHYLSPTGEYANTAFGPSAHNEAMLGLLRAGTTPDATAVVWLRNAAQNGSWGGSDATGLSLYVLGQMNETIPDGAFSHLHQTQQSDGGWGFGGPASINSTAEVVLGLVQNGDNPFAPAWSQVVSGTLQNPADAVLNQQGSNGCWPNLFGPGEDPFATTDGVLLLLASPEWPRLPAYLEMETFLPLTARE